MGERRWDEDYYECPECGAIGPARLVETASPAPLPDSAEVEAENA